MSPTSAARSLTSAILARRPGTAPSRTSRGSSPCASTIVDGAPPGVGPASRTTSTSAPNAWTTAGAFVAGGEPDRLALVAVNGAPSARATARAIACAGTRTATLRSDARTPAARSRWASTSIASGPGQNRAARRSATAVMRPARSTTCARSAATSGNRRRGVPDPSTSNNRATAQPFARVDRQSVQRVGRIGDDAARLR